MEMKLKHDSLDIHALVIKINNICDSLVASIDLIVTVMTAESLGQVGFEEW